MKTAVLFLLLMTIAFTGMADEYNTDYCHDTATLEKWQEILSSNPDSDQIAALHALWIGLCLKVEARQVSIPRQSRGLYG